MQRRAGRGGQRGTGRAGRRSGSAGQRINNAGSSAASQSVGEAGGEAGSDSPLEAGIWRMGSAVGQREVAPVPGWPRSSGVCPTLGTDEWVGPALTGGRGVRGPSLSQSACHTHR